MVQKRSLCGSRYAIGRILAFDREDNRDFDAALPWIIRAAEPRAEPQGYGFVQSQQQAVDSLNWYCKNGAAEFPSKHPYAQDPKCWHGRAKALMFGWFDIKKDYPSARKFLEKAIAADHVESQAILERLAIREVRKSRITEFKPIDLNRALFVLFMMLVGLLVLRSMRVRQFIHGVLYKTSL